ncbi:hypothetical protein [Streptomyces sp. NPDC050504]|uniref:hypothetical protein n=1 Tax=Streptomyces sp. NPDC050504 TaxID=3365618 RepID=UPI0037A35D1D
MWPGQQDRQPDPYQPPEPSGRGSGRAATVAVVLASAVVVACAVTAWLLLRDDGSEDSARPGPAPAPAVSGNPRAADPGLKPAVSGWKTVLDAKRGVAYDVPPEWTRRSADWASYVADERDPEEKPLIGFSATAVFKEKWCLSDTDRDGRDEAASLAETGVRREQGARDTEEAARGSSALWVYGAYSQPDRKKVANGPVERYTTPSGLKGTVVTATSSGVPREGRCDTDGKALVFAFEDGTGSIGSWTFVGVRGVEDEVPDATVRQVLSTVRLTGAK